MARQKGYMTRAEVRELAAARKAVTDTGMSLRTEAALPVESLGNPWNRMPPGALFQMEVDDAIRTKLATRASRLTAVVYA